MKTARAISLMPLGLLESGQEGVVRDMSAGSSLNCRLSQMGLAPGAHVRVINNDGIGPLVLAINETRFALGRGMALMVLVEVGGV
jgi:Fe2+ transport system protein FeoA